MCEESYRYSQKLPPDCSDNEETDSDADEINAMIAKVMECDESDSDSSDEETPATPGTSASTAHNLNDTGAVSRTLTPTPTSHTSDDAGSPGRDHTPCQHSDPNILAAKDGSKWKYTSFTQFFKGAIAATKHFNTETWPHLLCHVAHY